MSADDILLQVLIIMYTYMHIYIHTYSHAHPHPHTQYIKFCPQCTIYAIVVVIFRYLVINNKISPETNVVTDEGNSRNEM